ncbi:hypothetical protein [Salinisphaera sp.]|uniref:hypothetical protein n=1 Tax=Salinisphaera sp. TaxID=1914330 RepID=UPI003C7D811D
MNRCFTSRPVRGLLQASLLLPALWAVGVIPASGVAHAADPAHYCLRQWPNDHDSYLLCQQLQDRNRMRFRQFLSDHDLNEKMLEQGQVPDKPAAKAAKYCLDRWSPDYQGIWSCTKRRTRTDD